MTWVEPVTSNRKAAEYVAKYVAKGGKNGELAALGFGRSWSCSRDWPRPGEIGFRRSERFGGPGWEVQRFSYGPLSKDSIDHWEIAGKGLSDFDRVGTDVALALAATRSQRKNLADVAGIRGLLDVREDLVDD